MPIYVKTGMRVAAALISFMMMVIFLIPVQRGIINIGNCFGAGASAALGMIFTFPDHFVRLIKHLWESAAGKAAVISAGVLCAAFIIYAVTVSVLMMRAASDRPKNDKALLIVLGCQVKNGAPGRMLASRLDAAYDFLAEHDEAAAVVSGGQGSDESISEAQCMRDYLVSRGISSDRIYMEDRSTSTEENLRFSLELIRNRGLSGEITIVTDGFHQLRAEMLAKRSGVDTKNISASTMWWLLPTYWVREWFGIAYYIVSGG